MDNAGYITNLMLYHYSVHHVIIIMVANLQSVVLDVVFPLHINHVGLCFREMFSFLVDAV